MQEGYAVAAAKADYRLNAVAAIGMVNAWNLVRLGWYHTGMETLRSTSRRSIQPSSRSSPRWSRAPSVPPRPLCTLVQEDKTPYDLKEAADYYLTPRCYYPRAAYKMLIDSLPRVHNFDAFRFADIFLKQPVILIASEDAGSRWHTEKLDKPIGGATK